MSQSMSIERRRCPFNQGNRREITAEAVFVVVVVVVVVY